jgi:Rps23 Pro-64 3,4-dihydroxylase Tpa1-like proline 4-hydroxylase
MTMNRLIEGAGVAGLALDDYSRSKVIQKPFQHFSFDQGLDPAFAEEIYAAFPSYHEAKAMGQEFAAVNEKYKTQITDWRKFPAPIKDLHHLLASGSFVEQVSKMFDIPNLLADPDLEGGGIHETNSGGHLDVHIDFNVIPAKQWHRRINLLFYFNKDWDESYGGYLDLWDPEVKNRIGYFKPAFNRVAGFATGSHSWHGVTPVKCPPGSMRRSFAVYYYTAEPPSDWDGTEHSTIFKARPDEWMKGKVAMPMENAMRSMRGGVNQLKSGVKGLIGRK